MMKIKQFGILAATVAGLALWGEGKTLYSQDFEDEVPGSGPKNWRVRWGKQGEDTLQVSGAESATGDNSLELRHNAETPMYGVGLELPEAVGTGKLVVSYKIRLSPGGELGFELRNARRQVSNARWGFSRGVMMSASTRPGGKGGNPWIGPTRSGEWFTVSAEVPVGVEYGDQIRYTLTDAAGKTATGEFEY